MGRQIRWKQLSIGVLAAATIVLAASVILVYGRVGVLHGRKFTLYVLTDAARGVIRGTEVWLDGQRVGVVKAVTFQAPSVAPSERLLLTLSVLENARSRVRRDSRVQVRSGGSIIGDRVVYLSSGTASQPGVMNGDTVRAAEQADIEGVTSDAALASRDLPAIIANVKLLADQVQSAEGTLGALGLERSGSQLPRLRAQAERLLDEFSGGRGSVGLALNDRQVLTQRAERAMAQVDSIRSLIGSPNHSFGRFRRDSTLAVEIGRVRSELATVQRLATTPNGTIGRAREDSVIIRNVHRDLAAMDSLFADIKQHPLRYLVF